MTANRINIVTKKNKVTKLWSGKIRFESMEAIIDHRESSHACVSWLIEELIAAIYKQSIYAPAMTLVYINGKNAGPLADFTSRY